MKNEMTTRAEAPPAALTIHTPQQMQLIKDQICVGASDAELQLFVAICNRTRLDPFAKQIHGVIRRRKRNNQWENYLVIQTGIDGYRLIAERSGKYEGQTEPEWCGADGFWTNVWIEETMPHAARVGVHREGFREPVYGVAHLQGYIQTDNNGDPAARWKHDCPGMLAKCAEALAIRKAFPNDTSGVYADVEMEQADSPEDAPRVAMPRRKPTKAKTEPEPAQAAEEPPHTVDAEVVEPAGDETGLPEGVEVAMVTVTKVEKKEGGPADNRWTKWKASASDGNAYFTFDKGLAGIMTASAGTGEQIQIQWSKSQYGRDVVDIITNEPAE